MAKILSGVLLVLALSSPAVANTISFSLGLPEEITLVVGEPTAIPAAIINSSSDPLDFGCAFYLCGGLFPVSLAGTLGDYVAYVTGPSGGISFREQFVGLVLDPGERFDFTLARFTLLQAFPADLQNSVIQNVGLAIFQVGVGNHYSDRPDFTTHSGATTSISAPTFRVGPVFIEPATSLPVVEPEPVPDVGSVAWIAVLSLLAASMPRRARRASK